MLPAEHALAGCWQLQFSDRRRSCTLHWSFLNPRSAPPRSKHPQLVEAFAEGALQQSGAPYVADLVTLLAPREFSLKTPGPAYIVAAANDSVAPPVFARSAASW